MWGCKQFGDGSGWTGLDKKKCLTLIVFLKESFEKGSRRQQKHEKLLSLQRDEKQKYGTFKLVDEYYIGVHMNTSGDKNLICPLVVKSKKDN